MVLEWFFKKEYIFLILFPIFSFGQDNKKDTGLSFEVQYLYIVPYNEEILNPNSEFDFTKDTSTSGLGLSVNYYFLKWLSANVGSGYEKINIPNINYFPILIGFKMAEGRNKESFITSATFGKHIGSFDKSGFIFRWSIGYRFKIYKSLLGTTEMYYSFQNIYKTYTLSKINNAKNIESVGIRFGIEIN